MTKEKIKVVGICGSLRKESYNHKILLYMSKNCPEEMEIEIISIKEIPLFNQDIEEDGFPETVRVLRDKVRDSEGLIMLCPEYNSSIPGVLKNAIDWISRKDEKGYPFSKKPIMIAGATEGLMGTSRAQKELRAVLHNINSFPMNKPELFVTEANKKIRSAEDIDDKVKEIIGKMMISFVKWSEGIKKF